MTTPHTCGTIGQLSRSERFWRNTTALDQEVSRAWQSPWSEMDPVRNPFVWTDDGEEEEELVAQIAAMVPGPRSEVGWEAGYRFTDAATRLLMDRYGRWVFGWSWAIGEGGGGGVVASWCCVSHSVGEPETTAAKVVASLLEWRDWLEELAEKFALLAPPADADPEDRSWHLERAATRLVTLVVDRTGAECGWYGLCRTVLKWFLASTGMEPDDAERAVDAAIGGRFKSWTRPSLVLVDTVGEDLAVGLTGRRPYRDH
ncbi:hypothetical protein [Streptomyces lutosisoli]|uniref:Uncharacterized protein n=1 Tax=Streptomyces lutosisoli TaxID=2665721 RepID=A0ABW2VLL0_9ACTN